MRLEGGVAVTPRSEESRLKIRVGWRRLMFSGEAERSLHCAGEIGGCAIKVENGLS